MPINPSILGFSNKWYADGVKNAIIYKMNNNESIRIFTAPYFIASKMEAFKTRGNNDLYSSHDLEDIIFVLDSRDTIEEELINANEEVQKYLRREFGNLTKNSAFEEVLIGHVEQSDQTQRKERIKRILEKLITSE